MFQAFIRQRVQSDILMHKIIPFSQRMICPQMLIIPSLRNLALKMVMGDFDNDSENHHAWNSQLRTFFLVTWS